MINFKGASFVSVAEAADMLNRTTESVRQLAKRHEIGHAKIRRRVYFRLSDLETLMSKKHNLPSFEALSSIEQSGAGFESVSSIAKANQYNETYLTRLVKQGKLVGYITISGEILIPRRSIDEFFEQKAVANIETL